MSHGFGGTELELICKVTDTVLGTMFSKRHLLLSPECNSSWFIFSLPHPGPTKFWALNRVPRCKRGGQVKSPRVVISAVSPVAGSVLGNMLLLLAWLLSVLRCDFGPGLLNFFPGFEPNGLWGESPQAVCQGTSTGPLFLCWWHMIVSDGHEWWAEDFGRVRPNPCVAPGMGINIVGVIAHALLRTKRQLQASCEVPWPGQQGT